MSLSYIFTAKATKDGANVCMGVSFAHVFDIILYKDIYRWVAKKGLTRINRELRHRARGKCRSTEYMCRLSRVAQRVDAECANRHGRHVDPHRRN